MTEVAAVGNDGLFGEAVKVASGGGGFAAVLLGGRWIINVVIGRWDRVQDRIDAAQAEIDQRWKSYTKATEERERRTDERCDALAAELQKCHEMHATERAERLKLEAVLEAKGIIDQKAQLVIAANRASDGH